MKKRFYKLEKIVEMDIPFYDPEEDYNERDRPISPTNPEFLWVSEDRISFVDFYEHSYPTVYCVRKLRIDKYDDPDYMMQKNLGKSCANLQDVTNLKKECGYIFYQIERFRSIDYLYRTAPKGQEPTFEGYERFIPITISQILQKYHERGLSVICGIDDQKFNEYYYIGNYVIRSVKEKCVTQKRKGNPNFERFMAEKERIDYFKGINGHISVYSFEYLVCINQEMEGSLDNIISEAVDMYKKNPTSIVKAGTFYVSMS